MFMGMDVSHPPPLTPAEQARGATPRIPSVVGVGDLCIVVRAFNI
jgi:hypothetical protein